MGQSYISTNYAKSTVDINGTSRGVIGLTSLTGFFVGANAWLKGDTAAKIYVEIVKMDTTAGTVWLRQAPIPNGIPAYSQPNYGFSDLSAYTVADNAVLVQPAGQVVLVWDQYQQPTEIS